MHLMHFDKNYVKKLKGDIILADTVYAKCTFKDAFINRSEYEFKYRQNTKIHDHVLIAFVLLVLYYIHNDYIM